MLEDGVGASGCPVLAAEAAALVLTAASFFGFAAGASSKDQISLRLESASCPFSFSQTSWTTPKASIS